LSLGIPSLYCSSLLLVLPESCFVWNISQSLLTLLSDFLCICLLCDMSEEFLDDIGDATLEFKYIEFPSSWLWFVVVCVHRGQLFFFSFVGNFGFVLLNAFCDLRLEVVIDSLLAMYLSTYYLKLDWSLVWPIHSFLLYIVGVCSNLVELTFFVLYCCFFILGEELLVHNMKLLSLLSWYLDILVM